MIYTGQLGQANSYLGNLLLGVNSLADVEASESLSFTETVSVNLKGFQISESLELEEDLSYVIVNLSVFASEELEFTEVLGLSASRTRSGSEPLAWDEYTFANQIFNRSLSETLTFTEDLVKSRFVRDLDETITLTETLSVTTVRNKTLSESLIFTENAVKTSVYYRSLSETIEFIGGYTRRFGNGSLEINYPEVMLVKVENLFVIKGFARVITLPNPLFDDSEATGDILTVYRTMDNQIYTYVKTQPFRKLSYQFQLDRKKAVELRKFFDVERSNKIEVKNHKSEIWVGYLTTNPLTYTTVKRGEPAGEQVEVSLDFEGIRVI